MTVAIVIPHGPRTGVETEGVEYPPDQWVIGGGTTALTRAPYLGLLQGFRDITVFGCDSSFDNGEVYCYRHGTFVTDNAQPHIWISANGEGPFETTIDMAKQVPQLYVLHQKFDGKLKLRCGGLMAAFMRAPEVSSDLFEVEDDDAETSETARID